MARVNLYVNSIVVMAKFFSASSHTDLRGRKGPKGNAHGKDGKKAKFFADDDKWSLSQMVAAEKAGKKIHLSSDVTKKQPLSDSIAQGFSSCR